MPLRDLCAHPRRYQRSRTFGMNGAMSMTRSSSPRSFTRRAIVKATVAAGGGLMLGVAIPRLAPAFAAETSADFAPDAFIRIDPDSKVSFTIPQVEMGQGVYTALSMLIAEELDAPF